MPLRIADAFCGAGGLSEGFRQARVLSPQGSDETFEVVYGFDKDRDAIVTFRQNHFGCLSAERQAEVAPRGDVKDLTGDMIRAAAGATHIDVLVGGPNCQGVSGAGLRNPDDVRNGMFPEFLRLVAELQPAWFVMENVPGLVHANNRKLLRTILGSLSALPGYAVAADVLLAAEFGCPQLRYRLFVMGTNTGKPIRFPQATHAELVGERQLELIPLLPQYRTVRDAIGDLENIQPSESVDQPIHIGTGRTLRNHVAQKLSDENMMRIAYVGEEHDWRSFPTRLLPERYFATRASDQKGAYGRLAWDKPAFTITASAGNISAGPFTHPSKDRPISVREAARLQGFGDDYVFMGEAESMYHQVGNAVPPTMARAVAESLLQSHFWPEAAITSGREGRITLQLLDNWLADKKKSFPVLTPRTRSKRSTRSATYRFAKKGCVVALDVLPAFSQDPAQRAPLSDDILCILRDEATLPANVKSAKRARVMLAYLDGKSIQELCEQARVSEQSIRKWVSGFYCHGLDGWRAHHTDLAVLADGDDELLGRLNVAVKRVRAHNTGGHSGDLPTARNTIANTMQQCDSTRRSTQQYNRSHMNPYLRELIAKYGRHSVDDLIRLMEAQRGRQIGTQYVGDLLAISDVIIGDGDPEVLPHRIEESVASSPVTEAVG